MSQQTAGPDRPVPPSKRTRPPLFVETVVFAALVPFFILVGVVFIAGGLWTLYEAYTYTRAANMLRA